MRDFETYGVQLGQMLGQLGLFLHSSGQSIEAADKLDDAMSVLQRASLLGSLRNPAVLEMTAGFREMIRAHAPGAPDPELGPVASPSPERTSQTRRASGEASETVSYGGVRIRSGGAALGLKDSDQWLGTDPAGLKIEETRQRTPETSSATSPRGHRRKPSLLTKVVAALLIVCLGAGGWFTYSRWMDRRAIERVEAAIASIGEVSAIDEETIGSVEAAYASLSGDLAGRVRNVNELEEARKTLDALLAEVTTTQEAINRAAAAASCSNVLYAQMKYEALEPEQVTKLDGVEAMLTAAEGCASKLEEAKAAYSPPPPPSLSMGAVLKQGEEAERKRNLLRLDGEWFSSARDETSGFCEYWIEPEFTNISSDPMQHIEFMFTLVNSANRPEADTEGDREHVIGISGPIGPGMSYRPRSDLGFQLTYGCGDDLGLAIQQATVTWPDGSDDTLDWSALQCSKSFSKECEG